MNNLFQTYDNELPSERVLFLYHGTGGNETDLLPLVQPFSQSHRIVGLRGNVQERGMNRFFLRNQDGTFVKESVLEEVVKLQSFLTDWCKTNTVQPETITHLGYSNGANFILANLLLHPESISTVALLHPILPLVPPENLSLENHRLFVSWSENDELMPAEKSKELLEVLKRARAQLDVFHSDAGHRITTEEIKELQEFLLK